MATFNRIRGIGRACPALVLALASAAGAGEPALLGIDENIPARLVRIDPATAEATVIGEVTDRGIFGILNVIDLVAMPDGRLLTANAGGATRLWSIDPATGIAEEIGLLNPPCGAQIAGPLTGQPDIFDILQYFEWFALGPDASPFITRLIDLAEPVGSYDIFDITRYFELFAEGCRPFNLFFYEGGMAVAPDGTLWATGAELEYRGSGFTELHLATIDPGTGVSTEGPRLRWSRSAAIDLNGIAFRADGVMVGVESQTRSLVTIDTGTGELTRLAPLLGEAGSIGGLTILPDGRGYYATSRTIPLPGAIPGDNSLYAFDPFTGVQSAVGPFDPAVLNEGTVAGLRGLAWMP